MEEAPRLNLPDMPLHMRPDRKGRVEIYDVFRRRWVVRTPEEYVRQRFLHYMVRSLTYSPHRIAVERAFTFNGTQRRFDAMAFDDFGNPLAIMEFKAPQISVTQKTFDQIVRYNMVLKAPYLIVSNGLSHFCVHVSLEDGTYDFMNSIPLYSDIRSGT